jgi:hypothetical protein
MKRHALMTAAFLAATLAGVSQVLAFGVEPGENNLGSEHEKITRSALKDLGPETLRQLAGSADVAGAVGFPDRDATGLAARPEAHCEGGDHVEGLAGATRTRQAAQDALEACRTFIRVNLEKAVELSGALASPAEPDAALDCRFGSVGQVPGPVSPRACAARHTGLLRQLQLGRSPWQGTGLARQPARP